MRKKIEWSWEQLDEGTRRAKVIGGWIVNTHRRCDNGKSSTFDQALVFVADRDHEWYIVQPINPSEPVMKEAALAADFESK
jgi:hypothetical protein